MGVTGTEVKTKKKCCKSGPRCKKCPVVYKKLSNQGLAERTGPRTWIVLDVTKKQFKAARAR